MGQVSSSLRRAAGDILSFWCPGCKEVHAVNVGPNGWSFNGDLDKPTFGPSVLVRSGHHMPGHSGDCWCTFKQRTGRESSFKCGVCHSFVRDGQIQFLRDCTHALAGQTVPLPELPPELRDDAQAAP